MPSKVRNLQNHRHYCKIYQRKLSHIVQFEDALKSDNNKMKKAKRAGTQHTEKRHVRPAKTQISINTRQVRSEVDCENADQTGRMSMLTVVFAGRTGWLKTLFSLTSINTSYFNNFGKSYLNVLDACKSH